jgi:hypothetical protein
MYSIQIKPKSILHTRQFTADNFEILTIYINVTAYNTLTKVHPYR